MQEEDGLYAFREACSPESVVHLTAFRSSDGSMIEGTVVKMTCLNHSTEEELWQFVKRMIAGRI